MPTDVAQVAVETPASGTLTSTTSGTGPSLVVLHRSIGGDSLTGLIATLAPKFSVIAPSMPGYDHSDRPDWARSPRDLASILIHAVPPLAGDRPVLVGFGLGGWVAAEMATMCPDALRGLVLVAPLGVQPTLGEIADPFLVSTESYVELGFADRQAYERTFGLQQYDVGTEAWIRRERNREMTTRVAWRPRMFDATLPFRLRHLTTPTLVVWGERDRVLPRSAIDRYADAIPDVEVATLPECGHMLECESPTTLSDLISSFADKL